LTGTLFEILSFWREFNKFLAVSPNRLIGYFFFVLNHFAINSGKSHNKIINTKVANAITSNMIVTYIIDNLLNKVNLAINYQCLVGLHQKLLKRINGITKNTLTETKCNNSHFQLFFMYIHHEEGLGLSRYPIFQFLA